MTAIVMNTLTGAVSEYSLSFDSMTPTHAGSATGLFELGGDLDGTSAIVSTVLTGAQLWDASLKKRIDMVYFSMNGEGRGELIVQGRELEHRYPFPVRAAGQSRQQPGKGIRENYLAFGFSNIDGDDFTLDQIEVLVAPTKTRRVG